MTWDLYYLGLAKYASTKSKDPSTKVGAIIVDSDNRHVSTGYNGFPVGIADDERLHDRAVKYEMIVHGEINALICADRDRIKGGTLYTWPLPPCSRCAAIYIQAGIKRVVAPKPNERWAENCKFSTALFEEAGVEMVIIDQPEDFSI